MEINLKIFGGFIEVRGQEAEVEISFPFTIAEKLVSK